MLTKKTLIQNLKAAMKAKDVELVAQLESWIDDLEEFKLSEKPKTKPTCCYCDADLTLDDEPEACRRCMDGPSDNEIYGSDFHMPSPMENYEERDNL